MFGRQPNVPLDQLLSNTRTSWDEDVIGKQAKLIQDAYKVVKDRQIKAAQKDKRHYDKRAYANPLPIGSRVLLKQCAFTDRHKLIDKYGEQQYVVVKCNKDADLYAIRPFLGDIEQIFLLLLLVFNKEDSLRK